MTYYLFFYSIALTLLFGICGFGFLVQYIRGHGKRDLWIAVMFLVFTCDNLIYFLAEMIPEFYAFYQQVIISTPFPNNIITISMVYSYRMVIGYEFDVTPSKTEKVLQVATLMTLLSATAFAEILLWRLFYHILMQCCVAAILVFGFRGLASKKAHMRPYVRRLWLVILIMSALTHVSGAIERLINILSGKPVIGNRVIGFETFGVFCVVFALWYLFRSLGAPHKSYTSDDLMALFVSRNHLTPREAELIPLLMQGDTNHEICEKLYISLSTVKVHTHNVYQKLEIERRSQLGAKYAEFAAAYQKYVTQ